MNRPLHSETFDIGWSIEAEHAGCIVSLSLPRSVNDAPEHIARVLLRSLALAVVMDGARLGLWRVPAEWSSLEASPGAIATWFPLDGAEGVRVSVGGGLAVLVGPLAGCVQLALALFGELDPDGGRCRPTIGREGGRYVRWAPAAVGPVGVA